MKFLTSVFVAALLSAAALVSAQTSVNIPLGNLSVTPPPTSFAQPASVAVNQTVTINGVTYQVTGTLSGTLTFAASSTTGTTTGGTTGATTGGTTGTTTGSTTGGTTGATTGGTTAPTITGVYNPPGNHVVSAPSGSTVTIAGSGFGAAVGTVTVAGLSATVNTWLDTAIVAVLPTVTQNTTGPVVVTPAGGSAITAPGFTITAAAAVTPTASMSNPGMGLSAFVTSDGFQTWRFAPGDAVQLYGWGLGNQAGALEVDDAVMQPTAWQSNRIQFTLPASIGPASEGCLLSLVRPDGVSYCCRGFTILPRG